MRAFEFLVETTVDEIAYPKKASPDFIKDYVAQLHTGDYSIDDEDVLEWIYRFDVYELKTIPIADLSLRFSGIDQSKVNHYSRHKTEYPPIVIDGDSKWIMDGYHRANAAADRGDRNIKAYIGVNQRQDGLDEMALPADWDPAALGHDKTFKSRLEYALQRARRLGGGSSRVAFVIPDNGRETVLKIAKNGKGLAQNEAEVDILADGYTGKLDIVIPIVDYDKVNPQPTWIQTELAKKVSQQKLSKLLHSEKLNYGISHFVYAVHNVLGNRKAYMPDLKKIKQDLITSGHSEQDIEIFMGYVDEVATLVNSSSLLVDDLGTASNWGEYNGRPVIIDLGFTEAVKPMYMRGWR